MLKVSKRNGAGQVKVDVTVNGVHVDTNVSVCANAGHQTRKNSTLRKAAHIKKEPKEDGTE